MTNPKTYRRVAPRLDSELVQRTLKTARLITSVDEIATILQISVPTFYHYEAGHRAPFGRMKPSFHRLCKKLRLRSLSEEWSK